MDDEYTILVAGDASTLSSQVNALLKGGWEPQGGVTLSETRTAEDVEATEIWTQAMVKRAPSH
jgi:hypothetical protein